jgi:hypothetical protein
MTMSDSSDPHTKTITEQVSLPQGYTLDDVVKALQEVYDRPGMASSILIQEGRVIVDRTIHVEDDFEEFAGEEEILSSWQFVLNHATVVDYDTALEGFLQQLMEMFWVIKVEGFEVNRILVPSMSAFSTALQVPPGISISNSFLGVPVEAEPELPSNVFIVCGAPSRLSPTREIGVALKGDLP